jgi:hypothetical protein
VLSRSNRFIKKEKKLARFAWGSSQQNLEWQRNRVALKEIKLKRPPDLMMLSRLNAHTKRPGFLFATANFGRRSGLLEYQTLGFRVA